MTRSYSLHGSDAYWNLARNTISSIKIFMSVGNIFVFKKNQTDITATGEDEIITGFSETYQRPKPEHLVPSEC